MKYFVTFAALLFAMAPFTNAVSQNPNDEIVWHSNYDVALKVARETGKPLLVSFRCVP